MESADTLLSVKRCLKDIRFIHTGLHWEDTVVRHIHSLGYRERVHAILSQQLHETSPRVFMLIKCAIVPHHRGLYPVLAYLRGRNHSLRSSADR